MVSMIVCNRFSEEYSKNIQRMVVQIFQNMLWWNRTSEIFKQCNRWYNLFTCRFLKKMTEYVHPKDKQT